MSYVQLLAIGQVCSDVMLVIVGLAEYAVMSCLNCWRLAEYAVMSCL